MLGRGSHQGSCYRPQPKFGHTGFSRVSTGFYGFLRVFTGFYGFLLVFMGFYGFLRVSKFFIQVFTTLEGGMVRGG